MSNPAIMQIAPPLPEGCCPRCLFYKCVCPECPMCEGAMYVMEAQADASMKRIDCPTCNGKGVVEEN